MGQRTCSVDGCDRPHGSHGMCGTHNRRLARFGSLDKPTKPPKPPCDVDGCLRTSWARGWCGLHYDRWRRLGTTELPDLSFAERFWTHVDKSGPDGCWLWTASLDKQNYGQVQLYTNGKSAMGRAHRVAWELVVGPVPGNLELDHVCHSSSDCRAGLLCLHRRCVNPAHLEPVTSNENRRRVHNRMKELRPPS